MHCVVCGKPVPTKSADAGGMNPWCSDPCGTKWRTRNHFLFTPDKPPQNYEDVLGMVTQQGYLDDDWQTLRQVSQVSKGLRPVAKEHEVGGAFHSDAVHKQFMGMKDELKTTKVKTGKFIEIDKKLKSGKTVKQRVAEQKEVTRPTGKRIPDIKEVDIDRDKMLEIALLAYNTAVGLRNENLPVILYRVSSKEWLTSGEKSRQTLSGAVRVAVGTEEVWPLMKTAAWIQGAIRARVPFVLLDDPRGEGILVGGVNKSKDGDAVYVRELHQITSTKYTIDIATKQETPTKIRNNTKVFILRPPEKDLGPLPLVPKIGPEMDFNHTWNTNKSNLKINDSPTLIRDHLASIFTEEGKKLGLEPY